MNLHPLKKHGCYVGIDHCALLMAPMLKDGSIVMKLTEVTHPTEEFLRDCNELLGVELTMDMFKERRYGC
jgi:hypothetical protein